MKSTDKLVYDRRLTEKEKRQYELDFLGELPGAPKPPKEGEADGR